MAKYTFSVESDELHEIKAFLSGVAQAEAEEAQDGQDTAPLAEKPVKAAPKRRMAREAGAGANAAPAGSASELTPATVAEELEEAAAEEEHPLLQEVTLDQLKNKVNEVLKLGGGAGKKLMDTLTTRFKVQALSALDKKDYADLLAVMEGMLA